MVTACCGGMIPSCCPVSSITRTARTRMRSLVRVRSSRRGERSKAITVSSAARTHSSSASRRKLRELRRSLAVYFLTRVGQKGVDGARTKVTTGAAADRHRSLRRLPVSGYKHVGDLLQLRLSDLIANLLLPVVQLHPQPGRRQLVPDAPGVVEMTVGNRQNHRLHGRQPQRPGAGEVLDEQPDEPLERAENGPMDDHRPVLRVVRPDVLE